MVKQIPLSQLKPWFHKRPWAIKPFVWFALIFVSWWLIPIAILIENWKEVESSYQDLFDVIRLPIVDDINKG